MPPSRGWPSRHAEVLARWPVVVEPWALAIEEHRRAAEAPAPTGAPPNSDTAITPLEAIHRVLAGRPEPRDEPGLRGD